MGLVFYFDQSPEAAPLYDCDEDEEVLTYDWAKGEWTDAKTLERDDKCYGLNGTGSERVMALALCDTLIRLYERRTDGCVLISWYWHDGRPLLSLLFFSKSLKRFEEEFPDWLLLKDLDRDSLIVESVLFA